MTRRRRQPHAPRIFRKCPECGGDLRASRFGGAFCPGTYDGDEYVECSYREPVKAVESEVRP